MKPKRVQEMRPLPEIYTDPEEDPEFAEIIQRAWDKAEQELGAKKSREILRANSAKKELGSDAIGQFLIGLGMGQHVTKKERRAAGGVIGDVLSGRR